MRKNKQTHRLGIKVALIGILWGLVGCSSPGEFHQERPPELREWETRPVFVLPVSFLYQLNRYNTDEQRFVQNAFIGRLHFSGGYVNADSPRGKIIQSKLTEFAQFEEYRQQVRQSLNDKLLQLLTQKRIQFNTDPELQLKQNSFQQKINYSKSPNEGRDNVNLPRFEYSAPQKLDPAILKKIRQKDSSAETILHPVIQQYYSHNAGWFHDQEIGCLAGVRIAIILVLYESKNGQKIFQQTFENNKIYPLKSSLNVNESLRDLNEVLDGTLVFMSNTIRPR